MTKRREPGAPEPRTPDQPMTPEEVYGAISESITEMRRDVGTKLTSVQQAVVDLSGTVMDTRVTIVTMKGDIVQLREHVNERNDTLMNLLAYYESRDARAQEALTKRIEKTEFIVAGKISRENLPMELLKSIGVQLLNKRLIRWSVGVLSVLLLTMIANAYAGTPVETFINFLKGLV